MLQKTMLVCDEPNLFDHKCDVTAYIGSFAGGNNIFSIPKLIEDNADELIDRYLVWLHELSKKTFNGKTLVSHLAVRQEFSLWWMSLLVEKSKWKSPQLYNVFRLMALEILLNKNDVNKVIVAVSDKRLKKAIVCLCENAGLEYKKIKIKTRFKKNIVKSMYHALPNLVQAIITVSRYFFPRLRVKKNKFDNNVNNSRLTFVSYLFNLDIGKIKSGRFYTKYWTSLHDLFIANNMFCTWFHLYVKSTEISNLKNAADLIYNLNSCNDNQKHNLIDGFINWRLLFLVLKDYFKMLCKVRDLRSIKYSFSLPESNVNLWPILQQDWKCSFYGKTAIMNCIFLNLFEAISFSLPKQKALFYILENQAWERALIYSWKKAGHDKIIGVQHTVVSRWDLRHFFSPAEYHVKQKYNLPFPDKVALNGMAAIRAYKDGGFPEDKIAKVEALRYLYLDDVNKKPKSHNKPDEIQKLLVIGDYSNEITFNQIKLLESLPLSILKKLIIKVKPHPNCPVNIENWPHLQFEVVNRSLDKLFDECDVVYTSNPTAGAVDAYLAGKKVITVLDAFSFNMSPLRGYNDVNFVSTSEELIECFTDKEMKKHKSENNGFFFTNHDLPKWKSLLDDCLSTQI